jgi:cation-transporting ATPase E
VQLRTGDQIVADGAVRASVGMQVDESLLTSESDPVDKSAGDQVLSGSFVVSASGRYQSTAVGADAYTRKLAAEARLIHAGAFGRPSQGSRTPTSR